MMKYYRATAYVTIHGGVLGLDPSQADARMHRLKPLGGNRYEVRDPTVQFKRGEVFGIEGDLPKEMDQLLEEAEAPAVGSDFMPPPKRKAKP
jgi:hypothetical protein